MKKKAVVTLMFSFLAILGVCATPRRILVVGSGRASESDKSAAQSEAYDAAQMNVNNQCFGTIENNNYVKTYELCLPATDEDGNTTWSCGVNVKAICVIGR